MLMFYLKHGSTCVAVFLCKSKNQNKPATLLMTRSQSHLHIDIMTSCKEILSTPEKV